jgi:beta-mannanase
VLWAFCPNAESVPAPGYDPAASWNRAVHYYPGDRYVDVLGMDGYNWGLTFTKEEDGWDSRWKNFREVFEQIHLELRTLAPEKPLFVFETSTVDQGGDREAWIRDAFETLREWHLNGLIWFQAEKEQDWRLRREDLAVPEVVSVLETGGPDPRQWIKERLKWNGKP